MSRLAQQQSTAPGTPTTAPASAWLEPHAALGISLMDHLFNRLDGAYPTRWRANFQNPQAIANWAESWAEAFDDAGLKPDDVRAGLKTVRTRYDWPPSVSEFIKACKPIVDPVVAYHEAVAGLQERNAGRLGIWSSPAVFWAAMSLKSVLETQTFAQVRPMWEYELGKQLDRAQWPPIPEPRDALPAPGKAATSKEDARRLLLDLGAAGVLKTPDNVGDPKRWAYRILQRARAGDESVTALQMREAAAALRRPVEELTEGGTDHG